MLQSRQLGHSYLDGKAAQLHVDLYTGPQAKPADLQICRRSDGSLWLLGEGACGKVYKVKAWPGLKAAVATVKDVQCHAMIYNVQRSVM